VAAGRGLTIWSVAEAEVMNRDNVIAATIIAAGLETVAMSGEFTLWVS